MIDLTKLDASGGKDERYDRAYEMLNSRETGIFGLCLVAASAPKQEQRIILASLTKIGVSVDEMRDMVKVGIWINFGMEKAQQAEDIINLFDKLESFLKKDE